MPRPLHLLGFGALTLFLVAAPVGEATVLLALAAAVDVAALLAVRPAPKPVRDSVVLPIGADGGSLYLRRRTVPHLRSRRPDGVIEAQIRWRQAGEMRRRTRSAVVAVARAD